MDTPVTLLFAKLTTYFRHDLDPLILILGVGCCRGDKAFCSLECRSQQMILDEYGKSCSLQGASAASSRCAPVSFVAAGWLVLLPILLLVRTWHCRSLGCSTQPNQAMYSECTSYGGFHVYSKGREGKTGLTNKHSQHMRRGGYHSFFVLLKLMKIFKMPTTVV